MGFREEAVSRTILVIGTMIGFALPAWAQNSDSVCFRRFEACAFACAALRDKANDGCLGRCLLDNGCEIDDGTSTDGGLPASTLPKDTLPRGRLPEGTLPGSLLK